MEQNNLHQIKSNLLEYISIAIDDAVEANKKLHDKGKDCFIIAQRSRKIGHIEALGRLQNNIDTILEATLNKETIKK